MAIVKPKDANYGESGPAPRPAIERETLRRAGYIEGIGCWWRYARDGSGRALYVLELEPDPTQSRWICGADFHQGGNSVRIRIYRPTSEPLDAIEAWFAMTYDRLECEPLGEGA